MTRATYRYTLTVLTGANSGAQHVFAGRKLKLADANGEQVPGADVLLDGIEGGLELAVADERLRIVADAEGVAVGGGDECAPGKPVYADLPQTIMLGPDTQINVSCVRTRRMRRRGWLPPAITAAAAIAALVVAADRIGGLELANRAAASIQAIEGINVQMADRSAPVPETVAREAASEAAPALVQATTVPAAPSAVPPTAPVTPTPKVALDALTAAVDAEGLFGLEATLDAGLIRLAGLVRADRAETLRAIRQDYDARYGPVAPLLLDVTEEADAPPLAIASAWLGATPEITVRGGGVMRAGDSTATGWTITRIVAGTVHLERGRQTAVIEY